MSLLMLVLSNWDSVLYCWEHCPISDWCLTDWCYLCLLTMWRMESFQMVCWVRCHILLVKWRVLTH